MGDLNQIIDNLCLKQLGKKPNLENPRGFNELMQWLKIYDQRKLQIKASDKAQARLLVPPEFRIPYVPVYKFPHVLKATHNSGSVFIIKSKRERDKALCTLEKSLTKTYGLNTGEWYYQFIKPRIIAEELIPDNTDYKFHCAHGKVKWVQVIWDRGRNTKEAIFTSEGKVTALHLDEKMKHTPDQSLYPGDNAWRGLTNLALLLSKEWRYVRVDLYYFDKPWFGELTFHPRAGCCRSKDEKLFGDMLDLDLTYKLDPVVK